MTNKDPRVLLDQMRQSAFSAVSFVAGYDREDFFADEKTKQAVAMSLFLVGELASRIVAEHPEFRETLSELHLESMRGIRNRIAHGYFLLRFDVIWDTVSIDLPVLIERLNTILDNDKKTHGQS